jgi:hypothetical protein
MNSTSQVVLLVQWPASIWGDVHPAMKLQINRALKDANKARTDCLLNIMAQAKRELDPERIPKNEHNEPVNEHQHQRGEAQSH